MISIPSGHPTAEFGGGLTISAVHLDIMRSHILTRLDGASLAALSSTSSELRSLCTEEAIWRDICVATWRSTTDPRVQHVISTFPDGHRSFFSDSYPLFELRRGIDLPPSVTTTELISAVDIYYKGKVIFSRVQQTKTVTGWFLCSPFRVDLLDPKESITTRIPNKHQSEDDTWTRKLEENLALSWILIDPTRKRAANISSREPVSVQRHWLTGEVHVRFSAVLAGNRRRSETEMVEFAAAVVMAFDRRTEGETAGVQVREVSLVGEDMEGKNLGGRDSLVILTAAMRGKRSGGVEEGKERYREYVRRKREREEQKRRREMAMDKAACLAAAGAAVLLSSLLCLCLFNR